LFDGDLVLKGGSLTVVNKKPDTVLNIESWTTAFVIYMDILLEKWPFILTTGGSKSDILHIY
jgi:hypothetical protein